MSGTKAGLVLFLVAMGAVKGFVRDQNHTPNRDDMIVATALVAKACSDGPAYLAAKEAAKRRGTPEEEIDGIVDTLAQEDPETIDDLKKHCHELDHLVAELEHPAKRKKRGLLGALARAQEKVRQPDHGSHE